MPAQPASRSGRNAGRPQTEVPEQLYTQLRSLVALGWFKDEGDVLREGLRRFLEVHRPEIMDEFVRRDVEWGLRGSD